MILRRALLAALALGLLAGHAAAEMRALVIGINKYADKQELRGSVNDAADIAHVLASDGVADITVLTDAEATRAAFDGAWSAIVGRAQSGDLILFTFSGHGIRVPERPGRHERPDGYDKGFLLQPYDETAAPDEILRDEDLYDLFAAATAKGVKILFVADACHAGAAVRGVDSRVAGASFRFQRFQTEAAPTPPTPASEPVTARPANPGVTIFSATDERLSIQEVLLDGQFRGALSYAVARGLEGSASEADDWVTALSLRRLVSPLVRELSSNRQIPQFTVPDGDLHLVSVTTKNGTPTGELGTVPLAELDAPADLKLTGAVIAADRSAAELIWDARQKQVLNAAGDVIATGVSPIGLQAAIDARRVLNALNGMMAHQPGAVATSATVGGGTPEGAYFVNGTTARFSIDPGDFNFVTMLDLAATGTVQFLWPLTDQGDPVEWTSGQPLGFAAPVSPPYGADFIVTLLSREPLTDLQAVLKRIHNKAAPLDFFDTLKQVRATTEVRVGVLGVYSCHSLRSNGQCDSMLVSSP